MLVINTLDLGKAFNSDSTSSAEALTSPKETAEDFIELVSYINDKKLNISPKNIYSLEETSMALENFLNRKNIGKTVIKF